MDISVTVTLSFLLWRLACSFLLLIVTQTRRVCGEPVSYCLFAEAFFSRKPRWTPTLLYCIDRKAWVSEGAVESTVPFQLTSRTLTVVLNTR